MLKKLPLFLLLVIINATSYAQKPRARDLGIIFTGKTGALNAITDVQGVEVRHSTIISDEGKNIAGQGPVRTGSRLYSQEVKNSVLYTQIGTALIGMVK